MIDLLKEKSDLILLKNGSLLKNVSRSSRSIQNRSSPLFGLNSISSKSEKQDVFCPPSFFSKNGSNPASVLPTKRNYKGYSKFGSLKRKKRKSKFFWGYDRPCFSKRRWFFHPKKFKINLKQRKRFCKYFDGVFKTDIIN